MNLDDILGGAIWAASAVAVAGYTYSAYQQTYQQFGGFSGGFGQTSAIGVNTEAEGKKLADNLVGSIPLVGKPLVAAGNWLQNLASGSGLGQGPSSLTAQQISRLQALPAPPKAITQALLKANASNKSGLATAANNLSAWAKPNKWTPDDVNAYLKYLGIKVF